MNTDIEIRPYTATDKFDVLTLLQLNTPRFFSPEEEEDLIHYLDHEAEQYFVVTRHYQIIGAGGINLTDNNQTGKISWDFLHPDFQGKGIGSRLLQYRIEKLKAVAGIKTIRVRTSQLAYGFYEKNGFVLQEITKDYWAKGYDMYDMIYRP
ncbi:GNAT family N-acetyltransferase [Chitinophaga nivalis]|uniref:GNAT family N-acetyltransferase n=1 Tax=Chitinophaga nivalis TaxID=2991709 RepID=A0ABT3IGU2_9BACT|nr:GNAT family N-acetyltransferase [Chitinophaga nivalis]MCW3467121.1 GNAT family N-acetyltransferase [Chitinophaga nivalis]MCW3483188.1 GNAT family N-acetyltransferase [Chitinophaga nivalis]